MMLHQRRCRLVYRPKAENATKQLQTALDAASGLAPTGLIIRTQTERRSGVFWLKANGNLMHRPSDGTLLVEKEFYTRKSCQTTPYTRISYL